MPLPLRHCCFCALLVAGAAITATSGCSTQASGPADDRVVRGTRLRVAHNWGEDAPFTHLIQNELQRSLPGIDVSLVQSTAGVTNLSLLRRGEFEAVSTYADVAYMALVGQLPQNPAPFAELRAIAALPIRELQVVVAPTSSIRSIRDLRGRRVSLGPSGTGVAITAALLLRAYDIDPRDLDVEYLAFNQTLEPLSTGRIDAAFWGGRWPNPTIARALNGGARIVEIEGPEIERFRAEYPFLRSATIPAGTYAGLGKPVHTVGVDGTFVSRADVDERLVYQLTRAFFLAVVREGRGVRMLRGFDMSRAAAVPLPLHPGAARYYREAEMRR